MRSIVQVSRAALIFIAIILCSIWSPPANASTVVRVCLNQEMQGRPTGVLSSQLLAIAGRQLPELKFEFTPLPWARCLKMAELGQFDAVLAGSFTPERAKSLTYPLKTDGTLDASKRMFNLGFVLIRRTGSKVSWDGERFTNLNGPLGAQSGYSVVEYLREQKIEVDDGNPTVQGGLRKLLAQRISGMIINPFNFEAQLRDPEFNDKLEIVTGPLIQQKPYFLILSNQFYTSHAKVAAKLWKTIEITRNSKEFARLYSKQLEELQAGLKLNP
jgi:polar amino acid transport system substrate-binding protein